jgi:hypothetical protein
MIRNTDGTPYHVIGSVQQFDPGSPDNDLFNLWDQEAIQRGGSPVYYYEVFISQQAIDPLYLESRAKVWSQHPIELFCFYEPIPSTNTLGLFGIDAPDEMVFEFNYQDVLQRLGHPPKIGSRLFSPHLREHWEIVQCNTGEYKAWNVIRIQVICKRFQESLTTGEGRVTQGQPSYKIV